MEEYRHQVTPETVRHGGLPAPITAVCLWMTVPSHAQNRAVYPLGVSAINSGLMPESTFTYSNQFLLYTRDEAKDNEGRTLPVTGNHTVILNMNTTAWVSTERILRARYSASTTVQQGTGVHPGETFDLDYSLMYPTARTRRIQLKGGLAGYEQRQTTAKTGPGVSVADSEARYAINGLGFVALAVLPKRTSVGGKYFREFANRATFQGYSLQIVASIGF